MTFEFVRTVPPVPGRAYLDKDRAQEVCDAAVDHPNEWARVPVVYLVPELEGAPAARLKARARNIASAVQLRNLKPFNDFRMEAKSRGTDVYLRVVMSRREMREAGLDDEF